MYDNDICVCVRFKFYERWASAHEFPFQNIVNDGSTTLQNRCIGWHSTAMLGTYIYQVLFLAVWEPLLT